MEKGWREFEIAVADFLKAADPNNNVKHNAYLPDLHTKKRRQRDVFLETNLCGFLPIKVLISCKKYKRCLNEQDIDAFNGELISSGAHKGVIYSYSGFNEHSVEKCRVLGISCCKLYRNQPPDIPEVLLFDYYCCVPKGLISLLGPLEKRWDLRIWEDLFSLKSSDGDIIDFIDESYKMCEKHSLETLEGKFPTSCYTICEVPYKDYEPLKIKVSCIWKYYRNRYEASLINGSYSFSDKTFIGDQTSPVIDVINPPGDHWTALDKQPDKLSINYMVMTISGGNVKEGLLSIGKEEIKVEVE